MRKLVLFLAATLLASALVYADVMCDSTTPCKFTRQTDSADCSMQDCPAIKVTVDQAQTVPLSVTYYAAAQCGGDSGGQAQSDLSFSDMGTWIVYLPMDSCMDGTYSMNWMVGSCNNVCADYACGDARMNCDSDDQTVPAIDARRVDNSINPSQDPSPVSDMPDVPITN